MGEKEIEYKTNSWMLNAELNIILNNALDVEYKLNIKRIVEHNTKLHLKLNEWNIATFGLR